MKKIIKVLLLSLLVFSTGCKKDEPVSNVYSGEQSMLSFVEYALKEDLKKVNTPQKMVNRCEIDEGLQNYPVFCNNNVGIVGHPEEIGADLAKIKNIRADSATYLSSTLYEVQVFFNKGKEVKHNNIMVHLTGENKNIMMLHKKGIDYDETSLAYIVFFFVPDWFGL